MLWWIRGLRCYPILWVVFKAYGNLFLMATRFIYLSLFEKGIALELSCLLVGLICLRCWGPLEVFINLLEDMDLLFYAQQNLDDYTWIWLLFIILSLHFFYRYSLKCWTSVKFYFQLETIIQKLELRVYISYIY